jgi:hypothetical protein
MNKLLLEGLTDAVGFVAGALLGFGIARLLGWDPLGIGYGAASMGGLLLCGLGGGAGVQIARAIVRRQRKAP